MSRFRQLIQSSWQHPVLLDGGMGSMLIARGMQAGEIPETWNSIRADDIMDIHCQYLQAGAEAILTNTFGGTPLKLGLLADRIFELLATAVGNTKTAIAKHGSKAMIIGDIGPTGKFLAPMGNISEDALYESFKTQATILIDSGVDALLVETMYDLREALAAVRAIRGLDRDIPVLATMTFDKKKRGFFTLMGDTPEKAYKALENAGADVVGANCTLEARDMAEFAQLSRPLTSLPLLFQANAGQPEVVGEKVIYPQESKEYADYVSLMLDHGANFVGGCCGTTPEYIAAIRDRIEQRGT